MTKPNLPASASARLAVFLRDARFKVDEIRKFIEINKIDVNQPRINAKGDTSYYIFAVQGNVDKVRFLIELGANPNLTNKNGQTALHCAAERGKAEIVKLLLQAGADPHIKDGKGRTALDLVSKTKGWNKEYGSGLSDHERVVTELLLAGATAEEIASAKESCGEQVSPMHQHIEKIEARIKAIYLSRFIEGGRNTCGDDVMRYVGSYLSDTDRKPIDQHLKIGKSFG
jgi:hypothetical protein